MGRRLSPHLNGPIFTTSVLCLTLYAKVAADTILKLTQLVIGIYVVARKMSLNDLYAFGVEIAVRASGARTNKKMQMRLAAILSSLECVQVG
jgi:hypothetical protein